MKRLVTLSLALALGLVMSLFATAGQPAQAQEDLDTILARAAARSFLTILTRPELASALDFYTADTLRTDNVLAELGDVTSYQITSADWLKPNETYQVEATLQPGGRDIIVRTGKYNNRWQVDGLELPASGAVAQTAAGSDQAAGLQPVAGNGTGKLVFQTQSGGDIYVINADGTGLSRVTHGLDPQLSPDGSQIVFTRWDPQYELFTINVDGTNEQAWFSGKRQMKSPTWSADGTKLVFSFQDGGRLEGELKKYSLKGLARKDSPVRIPDNARGIEFDQDGLEFFIPPDAYWWLAQIDIQNEEYEDLATGSRYNYAPSWDPADPNRLFYRTDKGIGLYYADSHTS